MNSLSEVRLCQTKSEIKWLTDLCSKQITSFRTWLPNFASDLANFPHKTRPKVITEVTVRHLQILYNLKSLMADLVSRAVHWLQVYVEVENFSCVLSWVCMNPFLVTFRQVLSIVNKWTRLNLDSFNDTVHGSSQRHLTPIQSWEFTFRLKLPPSICNTQNVKR